jgi:proteasome-associated ATPase
MGRKHQVNFRAGGSWKPPPLKYPKAEQKAKKEKKMSSQYDAMRRALQEMTFTVNSNPFRGNFVVDYPDPRRDPEQQLRYELDATRSSLENAGKKIAELNTFIGKLKESPQSIVTIMKMVDDKRGVVQVGGAALEINLPEGCRVGDQVKILVETSQAVSRAAEAMTFGQVVTVDRVEGERCYFESAGGGQASVSCAHNMKPPVPGERVQLDPSNTVALLNLGRDKKRFSLDAAPRITWDDIGGLEDAKEAIREAIEYPVKFASTYAAYGQRPSKGILLYGPPGCGKTLLASAAANSVSSNGASGFIYVKGAELLSKWVGESESTVRSLFARAREYRKETGNIAILFIDEADALLSARGASGLGNTMNSTVVPSFLAEMDGLEDSGAFVILGTNRPDSLDPAIVRDGRIDRRVRVGRPSRKSTLDILRLAMRGRPCAELSEIDDQAVDLMHSDTLALYRLSFEASADELICYRDMLSGASIAGVVSRAAAYAIHRDRHSGEVGGVTLSDLEHAIRDSFREMSGMNHFEIITDKIEQLGRVPNAIRKAKYRAGSEETPSFDHAIQYTGPGFQAAGGGAPN